MENKFNYWILQKGNSTIDRNSYYGIFSRSLKENNDGYNYCFDNCDCDRTFFQFKKK